MSIFPKIGSFDKTNMEWKHLLLESVSIFKQQINLIEKSELVAAAL